MEFKILVLVKQVPDTANLSGDVMQEDGTVNRSKLPAIFNPEDKVALELALQVKDKYPNSKVSVITMGPPRATDILRECLYMGADEAYLITDRKFAGADTLATSYVLSEAIKKLGHFDLIFGGRQAIDGDTAQVGPQTAEKLNLPQVTYAQQILDITQTHISIKRKIEGGTEVVKAKMPVLITVIKEAAFPRPFSAKRVMAYKSAKSLLELEKLVEGNSLLYIDTLTQEYKDKGLFIPTFTMDELQLDPDKCGVKGSPTKVYKVESVVLASKSHELFEPSKTAISNLIDRLMADHIFG
ncbi:MAG TPA: electron transfer flavoprotein subunit beta/FixA family protein [Ignavibacteriales bacterium]|nr:electron transfer flavoprotein subunit beta/FixA family protein [Ignavibacteriales bacterium]HOL81073.1 electron transfer flavoprotein subunit beta/FixA family protein [Ignavibacteriales bacterium]HOM66330.1 electron transfer flavoprotein subunit beta/FixA family protein [Ignavibacteriales bacterium]HPD68499.1 electron transfer flavoprotein subunit beta/FixA family protein [Ignavibacteriales bacterium]HPP32854.1 electron transfer flavoprotein subunit beta/FixA family protein [Ignavibacterial